MASNSNSQHIQVAVRCILREYYLNKYLSCCIFLLLRPINEREKKQNSSLAINEKKKEIGIINSKRSNLKTFDSVFGEETTQIEVYNHVVTQFIYASMHMYQM